MKSGNLRWWTLLLVLIAVFGTLSGCAPAEEDPVAVSFRGQEIRMSTVKRRQQQWEEEAGKKISVRQTADLLLKNLVMVAEAERRGLTATEEEVAHEVQGQRLNYEQYEEIRKFVDNFCQENGITRDEYYADVEA